MMRVIILLVGLTLAGSKISLADDIREPTVGAPGRIDQVVLPGTELAAKPINERSPMVVRIMEVYPHGDAFRYDLQFVGLEPGDFDLSNWLVRRDDSSTDDLPPIPVTIRSLLPPGQVEPNQLETGWIPKLGGYRQVMVLATTFTVGCVALSLYLLPRLKGAIVGLQWAKKLHGFGASHRG